VNSPQPPVVQETPVCISRQHIERSQYPNNGYCFNKHSINLTVEDISTATNCKNRAMDRGIYSTVGRGHFYVVGRKIIRVVKTTD
jgi:hypothetical protein